MDTRLSEKIKKTGSIAVTLLLIISTILCLVLVAKSVSGGNVSLFGYRIFYVLTGSMEPTINAGALIVVHRNQDGIYETGDIITFRSHSSEIYGQPNTHRIVEVIEKNGERGYITQGDANSSPDPGILNGDEIYGKVIWYSGKVTWIGSILGFLTTPTGFLLIVLLPILLITISQMKDFTKAYREALKETAQKSMQNQNERNGQNERKQ